LVVTENRLVKQKTRQFSHHQLMYDVHHYMAVVIWMSFSWVQKQQLQFINTWGYGLRTVCLHRWQCRRM